jgi:hypothetical protein
LAASCSTSPHCTSVSGSMSRTAVA